MSTTKKTTAKKAIKKTTTAKKAVKKTITAKKAVKKTTTAKIPMIEGASLYFETLARNINEAAVVGYEKIEYYDSMFGIRAEVKKGKKIIIETGFSDLFANLVENGKYEICEYQINHKKINKKKFK